MLLFVNVAFGMVQENLHIPLHDIWIDGLASAGYNDLMIGNFPWKLVALIVVYIVGGVFVTMKIFDRKELDL